MIEVKVNNAEVLAALERLSKAAANPRPALVTIGERLVQSTKARFDTGTAPDGSKWKPNSQVTYLRQLVDSKGGDLDKLHLNKYKEGDHRYGKINAEGKRTIMGKRPLVASRQLGYHSISKDVVGNYLYVGSSAEYAATQQFGAKQGAFGRDKRNHPLPWGDIPARPFLGVSDEDASEILSVVSDYLRRVM